MRTIRFLLTINIFLLFVGGPIAHGQTNPTKAIRVPVCTLLNKPADFGHKLIQTTGEIHFAFEEFQIVDSRCPDAWPWIWLYYGDHAWTTPFAAFRDLPSTPEVHFVNDDQMKSFKKLIALRRDHRPDGSSCYDRECNFYRVTATITGYFLAGEPQEVRAGGATIIWGYGHLGCCHALIIERVTDLKPQRTQVPEGGVYSCKKSAWKLSRETAKQLFPNSRCEHLLGCQVIENRNFQTIARHWHDQVDYKDGGAEDSDSGNSSWYSSDLLLSYEILGSDKSGRPTSITREVCRPVK